MKIWLTVIFSSILLLEDSAFAQAELMASTEGIDEGHFSEARHETDKTRHNMEMNMVSQVQPTIPYPPNDNSNRKFPMSEYENNRNGFTDQRPTNVRWDLMNTNYREHERDSKYNGDRRQPINHMEEDYNYRGSQGGGGGREIFRQQYPGPQNQRIPPQSYSSTDFDRSQGTRSYNFGSVPELGGSYDIYEVHQQGRNKPLSQSQSPYGRDNDYWRDNSGYNDRRTQEGFSVSRGQGQYQQHQPYQQVPYYRGNDREFQQLSQSQGQMSEYQSPEVNMYRNERAQRLRFHGNQNFERNNNYS